MDESVTTEDILDLKEAAGHHRNAILFGGLF